MASRHAYLGETTGNSGSSAKATRRWHAGISLQAWHATSRTFNTSRTSPLPHLTTYHRTTCLHTAHLPTYTACPHHTSPHLNLQTHTSSYQAWHAGAHCDATRWAWAIFAPPLLKGRTSLPARAGYRSCIAPRLSMHKTRTLSSRYVRRRIAFCHAACLSPISINASFSCARDRR